MRVTLHLNTSVLLEILTHLQRERMPIGNAVAIAVADQATMEGIWDYPYNRVLQSSIDVTAIMTGYGLDFVPVLMLEEVPPMTPATVASKISRQRFPVSSPVNRSRQPGVFPRRQGADPVERNCICCRFWRRHIAPPKVLPRRQPHVAP